MVILAKKEALTEHNYAIRKDDVDATLGNNKHKRA